MFTVLHTAHAYLVLPKNTAMLLRLIKGVSAFAITLALGACGAFDGKAVDPTAGWSANKLYAEAKDEMSSGNWDAAIKLLEKLEARYPFGRYAQQAQIETIYVYYREGEQALALAAADRFIKLHPSHPSLDYIYYMKGLINFNDKLGLLSWISKQDVTERDSKAARDAFDNFKVLVTRFPASKYAPDATERMKYLVNAIASNEVHVARYYYRRGAYLASANRAQDVIENFQQAPAVEEALFILVKSYDALGLHDLRDDAERVMRKNFPNSAYLEAGKPIVVQKSWWQIW